MIIIAINRFVIIVNCFDKALTEIFQFCRASPKIYFIRLILMFFNSITSQTSALRYFFVPFFKFKMNSLDFGV